MVQGGGELWSFEFNCKFHSQEDYLNLEPIELVDESQKYVLIGSD